VNGSRALMDTLHWRAIKKLDLIEKDILLEKNKNNLYKSLINSLKAYKLKREKDESSLFSL
jgi:hypothetical protein